MLQGALIAAEGRESRLAPAIGGDLKGRVSLLLYLAAIGLASVNQWIAGAIYISVAALWFISDRRHAGAVEPESRRA